MLSFNGSRVERWPNPYPPYTRKGNSVENVRKEQRRVEIKEIVY
jgi:hypothetical protein